MKKKRSMNMKPGVIAFLIFAAVCLVLGAVWFFGPDGASVRDMIWSGNTSASGSSFVIQELTIRGRTEQHFAPKAATGETSLVPVPVDPEGTNYGAWSVSTEEGQVVCFNVDTTTNLATTKKECPNKAQIQPGEIFSYACTNGATNCPFELIRTLPEQASQ